MENKHYAYWLCSVPGVGNRTIERLQEIFGTAEQIYYASEEQWAKVLTASQLEQMKQQKVGWNLQEQYEKMTAQGIRFLLQEDEDYPKRLLQIPDAPYGIFVKGQLPIENKLSVAMIGARDCSEYGRFVAMELGKYLGENDVQVISGMARGIDGISQEAALKAGGVSFAVLGSGVDVCYPARNRALYERLQEKGGILSIYPPGTLPKPQNFPPRNRIVSGLADVVVVIEARQQSGTLITVDMALEQGKEVYVVPGRITDRLSDGCNKLLKQGAGVVLSPEEFLIEIRELWKQQQESAMCGNAMCGNAMCGNFREVIAERVEKGRENIRRKIPEIDRAGVDGVGREVTQHEEDRKMGKKSEVTQCDEEGRIKTKRLSEKVSVAPKLQPIYDLLDFYPQSPEQLLEKLSDRTSYSVSTLNIALMQLCLANQAIQVTPGYFCRRQQRNE